MAVAPKMPQLKVPAILMVFDEQGRPLVIESKAEIADKMPKDMAFEEVSSLMTMSGHEYTIYAPLGMFSKGKHG